MTPPPDRLPRPVKLLGAVSLLNDWASEMVYPLLPSFVTQTLGAGAATLGALDGAAEAAASLIKLWAGRASDRLRRAPLILAGYGLAVVVRPVIAVTAAAWQVVGLRVVDRMGKGLRTPPRDAFIGDVTAVHLRGRAFGLHRGLDHLGAVLGGVTAWWLLSSGWLGLRGVIAASLVPGVAVLLLAALAVRGSDGHRAASPSTGTAGSSFSLSRGIPPLLIVLAAFAFLKMPDALLILRAQDMGVALVQVPLLWGAVSVARSAASWAGGWLADRLSAWATVIGGWLLYAAAAVLFAAGDGAAAGWGLFVLVGAALSLLESPERALVAALGERVGRGAAFGAYHALVGLAALPGALALGAVYQWVGGPVALVVSAGAVVLLAAAMPLAARTGTTGKARPG